MITSTNDTPMTLYTVTFHCDYADCTVQVEMPTHMPYGYEDVGVQASLIVEDFYGWAPLEYCNQYKVECDNLITFIDK